MNGKISPEEYRNIIESLELDTLYLTELNTKFNEEFLPSSLSLDIGEKYTFEQKQNILEIYYILKIIAKDEKKEKPVIALRAKYTIKYSITRDIQVTKNFMKIFGELTLGMMLWTYFRELVNNIIYRMGMPPLILPLKKKPLPN
jgi:preprotein translocase subunit SecB